MLLFGLLVVVQASTVKDEATLSGLVFTNVTEDEEPQWNDHEIPPLLGGWRDNHASVVVENPENEEDQAIVVLGGYIAVNPTTDSVILLNVGKGIKEWREGPPLNEKRHGHAAVVCNGWVFAIGGNNSRYLDTIEYIRVADLLEMSVDSQRNNWMTLDGRLSSKRSGLRAAVVRNRYIVIAGGKSPGDSLSTVELIDTEAEGEPALTSGPSLNNGRWKHGIAVSGNRVYVVGGYSAANTTSSMEFLEFSMEYFEFSTNEIEGDVTFSSSWTVDQTPAFVEPRRNHAILGLGSSLLVAGGSDNSGSLKSVRVLDKKASVAWNLPDTATTRYECTMVGTSNGIVVIGGSKLDSCVTLPLITKKQQLKV